MVKHWQILKRGTWKYDGVTLTSIEVIKQNWDFYFEEGYDEAEPSLNENGDAYYVIIGAYSDILKSNRSHTCLSLSEAIDLANKIVPGGINWE